VRSFNPEPVNEGAPKASGDVVIPALPVLSGIVWITLRLAKSY